MIKQSTQKSSSVNSLLKKEETKWGLEKLQKTIKENLLYYRDFLNGCGLRFVFGVICRDFNQNRDDRDGSLEELLQQLASSQQKEDQEKIFSYLSKPVTRKGVAKSILENIQEGRIETKESPEPYTYLYHKLIQEAKRVKKKSDLTHVGLELINSFYDHLKKINKPELNQKLLLEKAIEKIKKEYTKCDGLYLGNYNNNDKSIIFSLNDFCVLLSDQLNKKEEEAEEVPKVIMHSNEKKSSSVNSSLKEEETKWGLKELQKIIKKNLFYYRDFLNKCGLRFVFGVICRDFNQNRDDQNRLLKELLQQLASSQQKEDREKIFSYEDQWNNVTPVTLKGIAKSILENIEQNRIVPKESSEPYTYLYHKFIQEAKRVKKKSDLNQVGLELINSFYDHLKKVNKCQKNQELLLKEAIEKVQKEYAKCDELYLATYNDNGKPVNLSLNDFCALLSDQLNKKEEEAEEVPKVIMHSNQKKSSSVNSSLKEEETKWGLKELQKIIRENLLYYREFLSKCGLRFVFGVICRDFNQNRDDQNRLLKELLQNLASSQQKEDQEEIFSYENYQNYFCPVTVKGVAESILENIQEGSIETKESSEPYIYLYHKLIKKAKRVKKKSDLTHVGLELISSFYDHLKKTNKCQKNQELLLKEAIEKIKKEYTKWNGLYIGTYSDNGKSINLSLKGFCTLLSYQLKKKESEEESKEEENEVPSSVIKLMLNSDYHHLKELELQEEKKNKKENFFTDKKTEEKAHHFLEKNPDIAKLFYTPERWLNKELDRLIKKIKGFISEYKSENRLWLLSNQGMPFIFHHVRKLFNKNQESCYGEDTPLIAALLQLSKSRKKEHHKVILSKFLFKYDISLQSIGLHMLNYLKRCNILFYNESLAILNCLIQEDRYKKLFAKKSRSELELSQVVTEKNEAILYELIKKYCVNAERIRETGLLWVFRMIEQAFYESINKKNLSLLIDILKVFENGEKVIYEEVLMGFQPDLGGILVSPLQTVGEHMKNFLKKKQEEQKKEKQKKALFL